MRKTELKELYKMMFPDYPDIVTVAQLQQMLGVSRHLAYDLINNGYISGVKIGNAYKIPKVNVINYVMEEGVKNGTVDVPSNQQGRTGMGTPHQKDGRGISRAGRPRMARSAAYVGPDRYSAGQPAFRFLLRSARCRIGKPNRGCLEGLPLHGAALH